MLLKRASQAIIRHETALNQPFPRRGFLAALGALILRPAMALTKPTPRVMPWVTEEYNFGPDFDLGLTPRYFRDFYLDISVGPCVPMLVQVQVDGQVSEVFNLDDVYPVRKIHYLPIQRAGRSISIKMASPSKFRVSALEVKFMPESHFAGPVRWLAEETPRKCWYR